MINLFRQLFGRLMHTDDVPVAAPEMLRDLLLLTGDADAYGVTVEEIAGWAAAERRAVEKWAVAVHLRASDHDDAAVPLVPDVICERHAAFVARCYEGG